MKAITIRFLLISLSLFMLGIMYTGCGEGTVKKVTTVSGKVDDKGIHVWSNAKDNGDGSSWEKAYNNLQKAIEAAKAGKNKVYITAGIYKPTNHPNGGSTDREKHFALRNGVEVIGGYSGNGKQSDPSIYKTILNGDIGKEDDISDNVYHIFYHSKGSNLDKTAKLKNVIITKGNANNDNNLYYYYGGGMYNYDSSPTLNNCEFIKNKANSGGGMFNNGSSPKLTNCTFTNNTVRYTGGGMYNDDSSSPKLTNCQFTGNKAGLYGGGMYNKESSPTLNDCTFTDNKANTHGGGMYNKESSPTLNKCTFTDNRAGSDGGGMSNYMSSPTLNKCTFTYNKATRLGGGMRNISSSPELNNCRFNKNIAGSIEDKKEGKGGAIYNDNREHIKSSNIKGSPTYGTGDNENKKVIKKQGDNYVYVKSDLE